MHRFGFMFFSFLMGLSLISTSAFAESEEHTIAAVTDLRIGATQHSFKSQHQTFTKPYGAELKALDLNHDLQLNEFDIKQFRSIVESLNGANLTGLQLGTKFRNLQKNQMHSFPILYDLDRDGYFTDKDVNVFMVLINRLDTGTSRGKELSQNFMTTLFPNDA